MDIFVVGCKYSRTRVTVWRMEWGVIRIWEIRGPAAQDIRVEAWKLRHSNRAGPGVRSNGQGGLFLRNPSWRRGRVRGAQSRRRPRAAWHSSTRPPTEPARRTGEFPQRERTSVSLAPLLRADADRKLVSPASTVKDFRVRAEFQFPQDRFLLLGIEHHRSAAPFLCFVARRTLQGADAFHAGLWMGCGARRRSRRKTGKGREE
jgi:hypothetical protein